MYRTLSLPISHEHEEDPSIPIVEFLAEHYTVPIMKENGGNKTYITVASSTQRVCEVTSFENASIRSILAQGSLGDNFTPVQICY